MIFKLLTFRPARVYAVVMDEGDKLSRSLDLFAAQTGVDAAAFTAIGAVSSATLGFFDPDISDYREIHVAEQAEVVSLVGDITGSDDMDGGPGRTVHGHLVVALADGATIGGHLLEATVRPTMEVIVTEHPAHLRRHFDPRSGLALVDLQGSYGIESSMFVGQGDTADRS
jgi:uncharacterized protein